MEAARSEREKEAAAARAVEELRDGVVLGLGSGSTVAHVVRALGARRRRGLRVGAVVVASASTERIAREEGLQTADLDRRPCLDVTIDGADEVDERLALSKGGGGALLHEKILAAASDRVVIVVDSGKVVRRLTRPVAVEVLVFGLSVARRGLTALGARPSLRRGADGAPFVTEEGNHLLDCDFGEIDDPAALGRALDAVVGVVEHGLFTDVASEVLVGRGSSVDVLVPPR